MSSSTFQIPGLSELHKITSGDPSIRIAVLDGPADLSHPVFSNSTISKSVCNSNSYGPAIRHGTQIASLLFGGSYGRVNGISPKCSGLLIPIFQDDESSILPCSEVDLARAISIAIQQRADIINISAGKFTLDTTTHPLLDNAIQRATSEGILILAAAGNDGCSCHHLPGFHRDILTIGASDSQGRPSEFSNWGEQYRTKGILLPGENVPVAIPGCSESEATGTSIATAIASGLVALLISAMKSKGASLAPIEIRDIIFETAIKCNKTIENECDKFLLGHLDLIAAMKRLGIILPSPLHETTENKSDIGPNSKMNQSIYVEPSNESIGVLSMTETEQTLQHEIKDETHSTPETVEHGIVQSTCECSGQKPSQLVYVLGRLSVDFPCRTRREAITLQMPEGKSPFNDKDLIEHLKDKPWEASAVEWVVSRNEAPLYVVRPTGPFASRGFDILREFLKDQIEHQRVFVAIAGQVVGQTTLSSRITVPIIEPDLEGMYDWESSKLLESVGAKKGDQEYIAIDNFLRRMETAAENVGISPQDRALNFAVTNLLNLVRSLTDIFKEGYLFDQVEISRSALCHPDGECYKVRSFFFPPDLTKPRQVIEYTVDVSGRIPIKIADEMHYFSR